MKECVLDIETTDLDAKKGRIVCIGVKDESTGKTGVFFDSDDEKSMIEAFLSYFNQRKFDTVVGYNSIGFDIQFIFIRCLKYGLSVNKFIFAKQVDLMQLLRGVRNGGYANRVYKLEDWLDFLFHQGKFKISDSVKGLWKKGKYTEIVNYNRVDVEMTSKLWKRVNKVLWNEEN